jgi:hypothetical protein
VATTILPAAAVLALAAGCGSDEPDQTAYCADEDGKIIDDDYCDDDDGDGHGGGFIFIGGFGGHSYSRGQTIPQQYRSSSGGTTRINAGDAAARAKAGLPKSGAVKSGTRISGGIGTGGGGGAKAGSGAKGGSGGG